MKVAKKKWRDISNASFFASDARTIEYKQKYDGAMLLGLLMYMQSQDDQYCTLKELHDHLSDNAYIAVKDTLNVMGKGVNYLFNLGNKYEVQYYSVESYKQQLIKAGFKLVDEFEMDFLEKKTVRLSRLEQYGVRSERHE